MKIVISEKSQTNKIPEKTWVIVERRGTREKNVVFQADGNSVVLYPNGNTNFLSYELSDVISVTPVEKIEVT